MTSRRRKNSIKFCDSIGLEVATLRPNIGLKVATLRPMFRFGKVTHTYLASTSPGLNVVWPQRRLASTSSGLNVVWPHCRWPQRRGLKVAWPQCPIGHQLTSSQSKASTWRKCCLLILGAEPKNQVIWIIRFKVMAPNKSGLLAPVHGWVPKSKFIATLFSKTIDFDQPYKNALFYNGKMRFSQNPPKIDTLYYHGVK